MDISIITPWRLVPDELISMIGSKARLSAVETLLNVKLEIMGTAAEAGLPVLFEM